MLQINKDVEFCGKHQPRSEQLVVHSEDRGIANVVVWLDVKPGEKVAVHESLTKEVPALVRLENKGCRFDPHICVLRAGQRLLIENIDAIDHNTAAGLDRNNPFNELTPAGKSAERKAFGQPERLPCQVQCSIHPWMLGWLVVKDHPYVAVSDEHGRFELKSLPVGEHTLVVWQEVPGPVSEVIRGGQKENWKRGKVSVKVTSDNVDWGDVLLPPALFQ